MEQNKLSKSAHQDNKRSISNTIVVLGSDKGSCFQNMPVNSLINELKYSIKEACKKMGIGETTLRSIIKNGGITVLNLGGKYLLLERDIEKYLMKNYVTIRETKVEPNKLPPLPESVANSVYLRKAG